MAAHRFGMAALTAGVVLSFVTLGLFVATIGFSIGLDGDLLRAVSALLLAALGVVLVSDVLQKRFAIATSGLGNVGNRIMIRLSPAGLGGQFAIGLILGAVWSPCVGPTLGAASVLASQGKSFGDSSGRDGGFRTWCGDAAGFRRCIISGNSDPLARSHDERGKGRKVSDWWRSLGHGFVAPHGLGSIARICSCRHIACLANRPHDPILGRHVIGGHHPCFPSPPNDMTQLRMC